MGRTGRRIAAFVAAVAMIASLGALGVSPAAAGGSYFEGQINSLRASKGLSTLQVDAGLTASAQSWANHMAATGSLQHDPALSSAVCCYTSIAENVGFGPTESVVWNGFLNSSGHYANLTNPAFTHMGVGVAVDSSGQVWTAHRFMAKANASTAAPTPAPAQPQPQPQVTSPAPTAAPTTAPATPTTSGAPSQTTTTDPPADGSGPDTDVPSSAPPPADPERVSAVLSALDALGR